MYGNLQRVHIVQVDFWTGEGAELGQTLNSVIVHRMAWQRDSEGIFHCVREFENEYWIDPRSEGAFRFFSVVSARRPRMRVYLNGHASTWEAVGDDLHDAGMRQQSAEGGGLSHTNKVFVER